MLAAEAVTPATSLRTSDNTLMIVYLFSRRVDSKSPLIITNQSTNRTLTKDVPFARKMFIIKRFDVLKNIRETLNNGCHSHLKRTVADKAGLFFLNLS